MVQLSKVLKWIKDYADEYYIGYKSNGLPYINTKRLCRDLKEGMTEKKTLDNKRIERRKGETLADWTKRLAPLCQGMTREELHEVLRKVSIESYIAGTNIEMKCTEN